MTIRRHTTAGGTRSSTPPPTTVDVVLVGGGIMSATLARMLADLEPDWSVAVLERAESVATESSDPWNNAGTGHSGFCELNYMPDPTDATGPIRIARQFDTTCRWWADQVDAGVLRPDAFVHATPHVDVVFGDRDVDYLRRRYETLRRTPWFADMEFTTDPGVIGTWAPLVTEGRTDSEPIAATRMRGGTDVDFGALTRALLVSTERPGVSVRTGHEVTRLRRRPDGTWDVGGTGDGAPFRMRARFVFVGAGGMALHLLQKARLPEVRGYGVLPVGAAFLRCDEPLTVARHDAKVYGQAAVGAPPMSVPHLDKRVVNGTGALLFGPYATFSTRLSKNGSVTDFFTTLRWHNVHVLAAAAVQNLGLVRYLVGQLVASDRSKFAQLRRFHPQARRADWTMIAAGQRAQLVTPDPRRIGALRNGTELVVGGDGTIAGLLGASPGASTAVPIMLDLLSRCFPDRWSRWCEVLERTIATPTRTGAPTLDAVREGRERAARLLGLVPAVRGSARGGTAG